jgi:8-oxo-dGTP pyrophosphatase MutT (NUDIX family)
METKYKLEDILKKLQGREPGPIGKFRYSSVLLPLVETDGELHILFEVRSRSLTAQPGEISFPGGGVEPGETPREAAVRETSEELGIPAAKVEVLAELDYIMSHNGSNIYCMLGTISEQTLSNANPNPAEVDEVFLVPLSFFLENEPAAYTNKVLMDVSDDFPYEQVGIDRNYPWRSAKHTVFIYNYKNPTTGKTYAIWGLTAMMTRNFILTLQGKDLSQISFA